MVPLKDRKVNQHQRECPRWWFTMFYIYFPSICARPCLENYGFSYVHHFSSLPIKWLNTWSVPHLFDTNNHIILGWYCVLNLGYKLYPMIFHDIPLKYPQISQFYPHNDGRLLCHDIHCRSLLWLPQTALVALTLKAWHDHPNPQRDAAYHSRGMAMDWEKRELIFLNAVDTCRYKDIIQKTLYMTKTYKAS